MEGEIYYSNFEKTDIAKQLRECFAPESAYLYVQALWHKRKEFQQKLDEIERVTEEYISDIERIVEGEV
jgi:hypothetical protein